MTERLIFEIAVPVLMLVLGWVTNAYRNKQKKERDILDNVQQVIDIQNAHIERCDQMLQRRDKLLQDKEDDYRKLEAKYEHKVKAVKEAYDCEGDTSKCPVLAYDKNNHICDTCELKNPNCKDD